MLDYDLHFQFPNFQINGDEPQLLKFTGWALWPSGKATQPVKVQTSTELAASGYDDVVAALTDMGVCPDDLLPEALDRCPCCGTRPNLRLLPDDCYIIGCPKCGLRSRRSKNPDDVRTAWNRRA